MVSANRKVLRLPSTPSRMVTMTRAMPSTCRVSRLRWLTLSMITWISRVARVNSCTTKLAASTWIRTTVMPQCRPEPGRTEFLIRGGVGTPINSSSMPSGNEVSSHPERSRPSCLGEASCRPFSLLETTRAYPPCQGTIDRTCRRVPAAAGTRAAITCSPRLAASWPQS